MSINDVFLRFITIIQTNPPLWRHLCVTNTSLNYLYFLTTQTSTENSGPDLIADDTPQLLPAAALFWRHLLVPGGDEWYVCLLHCSDLFTCIKPTANGGWKLPSFNIAKSNTKISLLDFYLSNCWSRFSVATLVFVDLKATFYLLQKHSSP